MSLDGVDGLYFSVTKIRRLPIDVDVLSKADEEAIRVADSNYLELDHPGGGERGIEGGGRGGGGGGGERGKRVGGGVGGGGKLVCVGDEGIGYCSG